MAKPAGLFQGEIPTDDPVRLRQFCIKVANLFDQGRRPVGRLAWGAEDGSSNRTVTGQIIDRLGNAIAGVHHCRLLTQDSTTRANVGHTSSGFTEGTQISNDTTIGITEFFTNPDGEFEFDVQVTGAATIVPVFFVATEGIDAPAQSWV